MSDTFKIVSNIPVPEDAGSRGRRSVYPFRQMKVGQSFFVPNDEVDSFNLRMAASSFAQRNKDFRFTVRKEEEGYRVWRIKV